MSKAYLGAFIAIATIAVGAVDYINQAKAAGSAPGRFGMGDYVASVSGRFYGQRQAITATVKPMAPASAAEGQHGQSKEKAEAPAAGSGSTAAAPGAPPAAAQRADMAATAQKMEAAALDMMRRAGKTDADFQAVRAALEAMRAGGGAAAMAGSQMAAPSALAPDIPAAGEPAIAGGGLVGGILGALGFGRAEPALVSNTAIEPAGQTNRIKVNVFSAGSCRDSGLGKRCKVGD